MNNNLPKLVVDTRYLLSPLSIDNINFELIISKGVDVICVNLSSYSYNKQERWQWFVNTLSKGDYGSKNTFSKDKILEERAFSGDYLELASVVLDMIEQNKNIVRLALNLEDLLRNKEEGLLSVLFILDSNNIEGDAFLHQFYAKLGIFLINGKGYPEIDQSYLLSDAEIISKIKKGSLIEIDLSLTFENELREKLKFDTEFKEAYEKYQILYEKFIDEPRNEVLEDHLSRMLDKLNRALSINYESFTTELTRVRNLIESSQDIPDSDASSFICIGSNISKYTLHPKKMDENIDLSIINDILIQNAYSNSDISKITGLNFIHRFLL